ncbi:MAG: HEAT repeat domain-containing protein, partial [Desulfovibrio sp.]|nr:HEAT repeat domain-containing protein [Desulfovibrio sp.]
MTDCIEIVKKLSVEDIDTLREAAYEAGEAGCVQAVPRLAGLLALESLGVQEAADFALRKIGGKVVVAAVLPLLRSDDAPARNLAMDILRQVGGDDFPSLVGLLHDPEDVVRRDLFQVVLDAHQPLGSLRMEPKRQKEIRTNSTAVRDSV